MSYGFEVINEDGIVQLSEKFTSFIVVGSGVLTDGADIPTPPSPQTVYIRLPEYSSGIMAVWENKIKIIDATYAEYVIVVPASSISPSGDYGLRSYSEDGSLIYDSNQIYARPVVNLNVPIANETSEAAFSLPVAKPGRFRYLLLSDFGRAIERQPTPFGGGSVSFVFAVAAEFVNETSIKWSSERVGTTLEGSGVFSTTFSTLVIEV